LPKLLRELNSVNGIRRIRLLYFYPNRLTDEVIEAMATLDKVLPYIDIPLQHVHPETLRRMKRPWEGERYLRLFEKVRAAMPNSAIRTTFIVGFPGETETEFQALLDFCREAQLDRVGAFMFSREPGTPSYEMENQVPFRQKKARYDRLMSLQQKISQSINTSWVGREIEVLVESAQAGQIVGRSFRDAPEIDGLVYATGACLQGEFRKILVEKAEPYDLKGKIVQPALVGAVA
jgi:ribosomal protein S12 methylthiotransferase